MRPLRRVAEEEFVLIVVLAAFGTVFLAVFPPQLLVADSWLTLVAGREVWEHGLPEHDELTVLGLGRTWTDQQWLAQLFFYGVHSAGGHAFLAVAGGAFVVTAFVLSAAGARSLGAGPRALVLVFFPVLLAAPWAWTIRAQLVALPLFTGLIWLLASEARRPSRRAYLVFPLLVLWANVHGSVALAALLTMFLGGLELVSSRGRSGVRSLALILLPPLAMLATPYGPATTLRYYHLLLVDPPFPRELVTEWQRADPGWDTLAFYVLAALALVVVLAGRRRLTTFDVCTLVFTFAGALLAIRGIPWFALACMVLLPVAIGRRLEGPEPLPRKQVNGALSFGAVGVLAVVVVAALVRSDAWYSRNWPEGAVAAVRHAGDPSELRVYATSRDADWILWRIPELRGRLAYDVRFEIYDQDTFERTVRFKGEQGDDWKSIADGFNVVVLDTASKPSHVDDFLAELGARALYRDDRITVVLRQQTS
ncbi:MAG: hypothetical protein H0U82_09800 [Actinobacteria bacterium]|nr:hypothetical protein [Actinomycetota bacterium]